MSYSKVDEPVVCLDTRDNLQMCSSHNSAQIKSSPMDLAKHISSHDIISDDEEKTRRQTKSLSSVKNQTERNPTEE